MTVLTVVTKKLFHQQKLLTKKDFTKTNFEKKITKKLFFWKKNNENYQKIKMWQNSETKNKKNLNKKFKCDKTQKSEMWQNSEQDKTQKLEIWTHILKKKPSKCDIIQNVEMWQN